MTKDQIKSQIEQAKGAIELTKRMIATLKDQLKSAKQQKYKTEGIANNILIRQRDLEKHKTKLIYWKELLKK
jgi:hypothetical protein